MTNRPDFSVMLMAAFAILVAVISGAVAGSYGLPTDMKMLAANFGFPICCYVTTFRFSGVLGQNLFEDFLKNKSNQLIDVSGLFDGGNPARTARAEKIWDNKPVSQCVLIKTYAADTKTVFDRIVNNLVFALFVLLVATAISALAWNSKTIAPVPTNLSSGIPSSLLILVATLAFAIVRVYIPVVETAQRNLKVFADGMAFEGVVQRTNGRSTGESNEHSSAS